MATSRSRLDRRRDFLHPWIISRHMDDNEEEGESEPTARTRRTRMDVAGARPFNDFDEDENRR